MGYRRNFSILVVLFLVASVFLNSALTEACFCGQACSHAFQPKSKIKVRSPFHMHCSGMPCKSCNLEEGQKLTATTHRTQSLDFKSLDSAFIQPSFNAHPFTNDILNEFHFFQSFKPVPSLPLYIQNLTFLC